MSIREITREGVKDIDVVDLGVSPSIYILHVHLELVSRDNRTLLHLTSRP